MLLRQQLEFCEVSLFEPRTSTCAAVVWSVRCVLRVARKLLNATRYSQDTPRPEDKLFEVTQARSTRAVLSLSSRCRLNIDSSSLRVFISSPHIPVSSSLSRSHINLPMHASAHTINSLHLTPAHLPTS